MSTAQKVETRKWLVLAGATLLYLATDADAPNFNAALPSIQDYFSASAGQTQLLTSVGGLVVAALVLLAGALGDLYGRKRIFILGGLGLIVSLVLQALSPSIGFLTFMRGLDGVFSAITTPLAIAIITMEFQGKLRSMALGIFTGAVALGESFLPLLAGWLSDTVGWRSTFVIALTAAVLAVIIIRGNAVESKDPNAQKLDVGGVVFSGLMMVSFVGGLLWAGSNGFGDPVVIIALLAAVVFLALFIWWERRVDKPALELSLFRSPIFLSAFLAGFALYFVYVPMNPLMQFYFQDVLAYSALAASAALIPLSLGTAIAGPFAGKLTASLGSKGSTIAGFAVMLVGVLMLVPLSTSMSAWIIALSLGLIAVGYGLANPPRTDSLMSAAPDDIAGVASSANSMSTEAGSSSGNALGMTLAIIFTRGVLNNLGTQAGLSSDEIQKAQEVIHKAMSDATTAIPGISGAQLDKLFEGAQAAASSGLGLTMLVMAGVLIVGGVIVWFGMRNPNGQSTPKTQDSAT